MMDNLFEIPKKAAGFAIVIVVSLLSMSGCFPQSVPLAMLPMDSPEAAALNLKGINHYHRGQWDAAFHFFQSAIQRNSDLIEAQFNAALALHQLGRHEEATKHFKRAGELSPQNESIVNSTLYRNHLGLSSTLERHMSGGYRYHQEQ